MEFTKNLLFITQQSPTVEYHGRAKAEKLAVHWGSRKLLMSEIELLALFWKPNPSEISELSSKGIGIARPTVVYIGAAPGSHIDVLGQMFPEVEFHLYDPREFAVQANLPGLPGYQEQKAKITIHTGQSGFFTDETAREWSGRSDVIMICDIRSASHEIGSEKLEEMVISDMRAQERWYNIMKPALAQLKFRLPYYKTGGPTTFPYLSGFLMKGIWTPSSSTEARLIPTSSLTQEWDLRWYENVFAYHNRVLREGTHFLNLFNRSTSPISPPELLSDFDSLAEAFVLRGYLKTRIDRESESKIDWEISMARVSEWITSELNGWTNIYTSFAELRRLPVGQRSTVIRMALLRKEGPAKLGVKIQKRTRGKVRADISPEKELETAEEED